MRSSVPHDVPELPDDVMISVQGVSRATPLPLPELPKWLARILPKSGLAGEHSVSGGGVGEDDEEEDDEEEDADLEQQKFALQEISFDVRAGQGVAIAGVDRSATLGLYRILTSGIPPTTGRVIFRGRLAAL